MGQSSVPINRITVTELRAKFNKGKYWERTRDDGDLSAVVERSRHPSLPLAQEPYCTKSQQVSYYDSTGTEVARVHQYLRTDGTVGLKGRPDPKRLFEDGILYRIEKRTSES
jgi:hypothetical protein